MAYRRRDQYADDISPGNLLKVMAVLLLVAGVIAGLSFWGAVVSTNVDNSNIRAANRQTERYNSLTREERQLIIWWEGWSEGSYDTETLERSYRDFKPAPRLPIPQSGLGWIEAILIVASALSLLLAISYFLMHELRYRYYDLPNNTYGKVLFWLMFAGWPFLGLSYLWMKLREALRRHEAAKQARNAAAKAETASTETTAGSATEEATDSDSGSSSSEEELEDESGDEVPEFQIRVRDPDEAATLVEAESIYKKFVQDSCQARRLAQLKDAKFEADQCQQAIDHLGERIRAKQTELGELLAVVRDLETDSKINTVADIEASWQAFKTLHGVYNVDYGTITNFLYVYVRVVIPYEGHYYDVGDFKITIRSHSFECVEVRSGVREDSEDCSATYCDSGEFCFGNRKAEIQRYLKQNCFIEALTIMIDSLHFVNEEDRYAIPSTFYRIDPEQDPVQQSYLKGESES